MTEEHQPPALDAHEGMQGGFSHFEFNPDEYRHHLDGLNLSAEQQEELLLILFDILRQFVDWGFNIHPVQSALNDGEPSIDVVGLLEHLATTPDQEETP